MNPQEEKLVNALRKIEQMSDPGSYEKAIIEMKAIATQALADYHKSSLEPEVQSTHEATVATLRSSSPNSIEQIISFTKAGISDFVVARNYKLDEIDLVVVEMLNVVIFKLKELIPVAGSQTNSIDEK